MTPELKEKLLRYANGKEPFSAHNHLQICDVEEGHSRIELRMAPESRNRWGQPHGGILFALADVACGVALVGLRQETCVTVSASIDFMAEAGGADHLIARGEVTHAGKRTCFCPLHSSGGRFARAGKYWFLCTLTRAIVCVPP